MSSELFTDGRVTNPDFLQQRLPVKNGSNETSPIGLFHSYEYFAASPSCHGFVFEFSRPHCKIPRKNGTAHRSGTYIKQCLLGEIEGYPYEWFGSEAWDAHLKSENDYYHDDASGEAQGFLPQKSNQVRGGTITLDSIRRFVSDGRAEAVKAAIWFLIREYSKPEGERKVLLIKDVPENVELWVAAIECAFSPEMARRITFATNRTKLGTQADSVLFYYSDEAGRVSQIQNRSLQQTRHPYCMIVGYHPKDTFCASLKPMLTSNFVLIDGVNKTASFEVDETINRAYYRAAVQYGDDISDFCHIVLPGLNVSEINAGLPDIFDAYKYLLDSAHKGNSWSYNETVTHLNKLLERGIPDNGALNQYILTESLTAYPRMITADIHQRFRLLGVMCQIARKIGKESGITAVIMDYAQPLFGDLSANGSAVVQLWSALQNPKLEGVFKTVVSNLLNDTELNVITKQLLHAAPEVSGTVMDMFFAALRQNAVPLKDVQSNSDEYAFVCAGIVSVMPDRNILRKQMNVLQREPELFNSVALSVAEYCNSRNPKETTAWWDTVISLGDGNLPGLCKSLSRSGKASMQLIEHLLANRVRKQGVCDASVMQAFVETTRILPQEKDTGVQLFGAWLSVAPPQDFSKIIRSAQMCKLSKHAQIRVFETIDESVPFDPQRGGLSGISDLGAWADRLGVVSAAAALADFRHAMERARKVDAALNATSRLLAQKLPLKEGFCESGSFAGICKCAAAFESGELNLHMLCAFVFGEADRGEMARYIRAYVSNVLGCCKGRHMLEGMIALTDAVTFAYKVPSRTAAYVETVQDAAEKELAAQFAEHYKSNMIEQVTKSNLCDAEVKTKLIRILQAAAKRAESKNPSIGSFFGGLFGKR